MACNCSTNKQINEIINRFGGKFKENEKKKNGFIGNITHYMTISTISIVVILSTPLLFFYIGYRFSMGNNEISFKDFLKITEYVGEQS